MIRHIEDSLQMAVADYLRNAFHEDDPVMWWHTPNGGKRDAREGARLKRMGVKPGVADLLFFWRAPSDPRQPIERGWYACKGAIELKATTKQSDPQKKFQSDWMAQGGLYSVAYDLSEVEATLLAWGLKPRCKLML